MSFPDPLPPKKKTETNVFKNESLKKVFPFFILAQSLENHAIFYPGVINISSGRTVRFMFFFIFFFNIFKFFF